jgi:hypothetical protein
MVHEDPVVHRQNRRSPLELVVFEQGDAHSEYYHAAPRCRPFGFDHPQTATLQASRFGMTKLLAYQEMGAFRQSKQTKTKFRFDSE